MTEIHGGSKIKAEIFFSLVRQTLNPAQEPVINFCHWFFHACFPGDYQLTRQARNDAKRLSRRDQFEAARTAYRAVGLSYGACECRTEDRHDYLEVNVTHGETYTRVIPVQYLGTRNAAILETAPGIR